MRCLNFAWSILGSQVPEKSIFRKENLWAASVPCSVEHHTPSRDRCLLCFDGPQFKLLVTELRAYAENQAIRQDSRN